jgi:hypothetical protein
MGNRDSFRRVRRPGRDTDYTPPPRVEVKNTWSYTSSVPTVFTVCTRRTLPTICSQPSRMVTPLRTPPTWHVSEQTPHTSCILRRLPDMHLTGESLARRLTTPLCQGRLTDQYTPAGGRSLGALLFYMSSPERTFETSPHRKCFQTTLHPEYIFHVSRCGHQYDKHELTQPNSNHWPLLRKLRGIIFDSEYTEKDHFLDLVSTARVSDLPRTHSVDTTPFRNLKTIKFKFFCKTEDLIIIATPRSQRSVRVPSVIGLRHHLTSRLTFSYAELWYTRQVNTSA